MRVALKAEIPHGIWTIADESVYITERPRGKIINIRSHNRR